MFNYYSRHWPQWPASPVDADRWYYKSRARARRLPPLTANHDRATVAEGAVTTDNTSTFIVYGGCSSKTCSSRTSGGGGGRGPFKNIFSPENYSGSVVRQRLVRARFVIVTAYAGELSRGARWTSSAYVLLFVPEPVAFRTEFIYDAILRALLLRAKRHR